MDADSDYLPEYSIFVRSQEKIFYPECSVSDNLNIIINVWPRKGREGTH